jgi:hypothetical protein
MAAYYVFGKPSVALTTGQLMYLEAMSQLDYELNNPKPVKQRVVKK